MIFFVAIFNSIADEGLNSCLQLRYERSPSGSPG